MKNLVLLILLCLGMAFCSHPLPVTTKTDEQATTSGTAGSAKATNELPRRNTDTTLGVDTGNRMTDSLPPFK